MNKSFTRWLLCMLVYMFSSATWALDQVGGVYQIGTGQDLADFAALVNGGDVTANAVLTADIDYTGIFDNQLLATHLRGRNATQRGMVAVANIFFKPGLLLPQQPDL